MLLRRARDRIDRDHAEPLDVESIARAVGMSAGHFSRRFREAYGEPPYSYLMTRRIERAMVLLRRGDRTVTAVCFAVGFSSLGTFSTRFTDSSECHRRPTGLGTRHGRRGLRRVSRSVRRNRSGIEKRPRRPVRTVAVMDITTHQSFLPHTDPDASVAFYTDVLGFEVRLDVGYEDMRWITVGPPSQPDTSATTAR